MILNAAQLCKLLHGELVGDGEKKIHGPSQIDKGRPGTVTFLANPKYEDHAYTTNASVLLVGREFVPKMPIQATLIKVDDVYGAMMFIVEKFSKNGTPQPGISDLAVTDPSCQFAPDVSIGAYSFIESECSIGSKSIIYPQVYIGHGTVIGTEVIIYPGVKIYPNTQIGDRCIIHANAVIGSDGFGYRPNEEGHYVKVNHVGIVIIEEDVEIGANTVIDRGTLSVTRIGKGTKIDNLVQIAHNVNIGDHTAIAAQAGIAGSSEIGKHVRIGGQVGIAGHIKIADRVEIQAQSGVHTGKFGEGARIFGYPAINYNDYLKSYAVFKQLPDYIKRIEALERQIASAKKEKE
ncbi:MAG: UDP-3-O-(3-hydroxymyristoyl)glucosamine N-acyltransferase [Saprospiraceae bacterium]|uniref:UDP-3-O-acylglucosamine N-acyltransferase n=1 Tax=Candidatus Opimibacter skivensis TaxID=2982028 RepID=A0A9D7SW17_9BACT|nr:UDP-3-O-(3-hydroxymyristoyl)glucosamine N-acyltransferase [Candidatus Opimibacter skivensis]